MVDRLTGDRLEEGARLLERSGELAVIDDALASARRGSGMLVLLEGEPGIGKTELLSALRERAGEGGDAVASARSSVLERDYPHAIVRQLFEPHLTAATAAQRDELLADRAALAAALFDDGAASRAEYETFQGLHRLCANLARERALAVVVDDVQWADRPSARFLHYLAGRVEQLPVVVALARCTGEPMSEPELLAAIAASPVARVLRPQPLSTAAVAELLADRDAALAETCREITGGNPFLLRALVDELSEGATPDTVRAIGPAAVARDRMPRIERCSPAAAAVAKAVAVLHPAADLRHAAAIAGVDEPVANEAAGALADRGILRRDAPWRYAHPIVRNAIYDGLATADRAHAHAQAGELLARDGAATECVAEHLARTNPGTGPGCTEILSEAASAALHAGRPADAATYLARALAEPRQGDRPGMLTQLGRAELRLSRPGAAEHLWAALRESDDLERRADIGVDLARALVMAGRCGDATGLLDGLVVELETAGRDPARLRAELGAATPVDRRPEPLLGDGGPSGDARSPAPAMSVRLATAAFETVAAGHDAGRAADLARRALAGGALLRSDGSESLHYYRAAWTLALCDDLDAADEALSAASARADADGSRLGAAVAACFQAAALARRGELARAGEAAAGALAAAEDRWIPGVPLAAACRTGTLLERDELADAAELIEAAGVARAAPGSAGARLARFERGRVRAALGQLEDGLDDLLAAACPPPARSVPALAPVAWHAETVAVLVQLDRRAEAQRLARDAVVRSHAFGTPTAIAAGLRTAGLVARAGRGTKHLADAAAVLRRSPARLELARTLVDLGAALRRGNRRSAARRELRAGLDVAEQCGATALARRARVELQAAGTRSRRPLRKGVDALTASERRVARLARQGLSNRAIARELFVTVKTVEWHLGQTYRKLDVGSRKELPASLDDRPGPGGADAGVDARVDPDANAPPRA